MAPTIAKEKLNQLLQVNKPPQDVNIIFVLSHPRSDMGKGTLVAHMLSRYKNSDAIKFDGLLNTNASGRHTATGHDDFGIYERYNPDRKFGDERYILAGYLFQEFIEKYGEYENLTFRPYFAKFFVNKIFEIWSYINRPKTLIIEVGGTIEDWEVDPYVTPAIRYCKDQFKDRCKVILITEIDYNNVYIKTKVVQNAVSTFLTRMITPDYILVREPSEMPINSDECRDDIESKVIEKIQESQGVDFCGRLVSVPYYPSDKISELGPYLITKFFNKLDI